MRRVAALILAALLAADLGVLVWMVVRMVAVIDAPDELVPGYRSDSLLAVMTVALGATYVVALVLGSVSLLAVLRGSIRRAAWFVLAVLATLLGLPDVVVVMLAGRALSLPNTVILATLVPAATFVGVIWLAAAGLTRPGGG
jgi:hypothetical protein